MLENKKRHCHTASAKSDDGGAITRLKKHSRKLTCTPLVNRVFTSENANGITNRLVGMYWRD